MNKRSILTWTLGIAILGALVSTVYALRNQNTVVQTRRALVASMINPASTLTSPRTYNQTLVETVDQADLLSYLNNDKELTAVQAVKFDVLPDSFHIQTTASLSQDISTSDSTLLATSLAAYLQERSNDLATKIFSPGTTTPVVALTNVLPKEVALSQSPVAAALYGAIAGALLGLFLALALLDTKK